MNADEAEALATELREMAHQQRGGYGAVGNPFRHMAEDAAALDRAALTIETQGREIDTLRNAVRRLWAEMEDGGCPHCSLTREVADRLGHDSDCPFALSNFTALQSPTQAPLQEGER